MLIEKNEDVDITDEIKSQRQRAEYYLLHYPEELRLYEEQKLFFLESPKGGIDENVGGGKSNLPGKPTESKALQSVAYDERHDAYYWLKAVEISWKWLGERKRIFLDVRRDAERNRAGESDGRQWVVYTQMHYLDQLEKTYIVKDPWISETSVRRIWYGIIRRTAEIYLTLKTKK